MNQRLTSTFIRATIFFSSCLTIALAAEPTVEAQRAQYKIGQAIPVSCLNRTIDTGEHITDAEGKLQYIPFPICKETGRPLELFFGVEKEMNCTIDFVDDNFYHLLEVYVHNDAPLTCRIPARPVLPSIPKSPVDASIRARDAALGIKLSEDDTQVGVMGSESTEYIPMIVALTGILQRSHLHVSSSLNVLLHAAPKHIAPGVIDAATAYSISARSRSLTKIVIGDALPLSFSVRWYPNTSLPSGWTGVGGHLYFSTFVYCLVSAGVSAAICIVYFRGVELPRRLKLYGYNRAFGNSTRAAPLPTHSYNGYGYMGPGKID